MISKERVMRAFEYKETDRVPMWCGASPEFIEKSKKYLGKEDTEKVYERFGDDFRRVFAGFAGPDEYAPDYNLPDNATFRSPFGIARKGYGYGQPLEHPLKDASIKDIHDYPWPDPSWIDIKNLKKDAFKWKDQYAILGGDWSPFWHDAIDLMGMEMLLVNMFEQPELVSTLFDHIVDYYYVVNKRIFDMAADVIDIFFIGNDLGSQFGPLIGEKHFYKFLFPHFKRLAKLAHQYGLKTMLHCCGGFEPLIPLLIEAGIDALQSLQPDALGMEPAFLKEKYNGKIVLNGCIDSHNILIDGTPKIVRKKTKEIIDIMSPGGGFILSPSHDYLLEETPVENVLAMYDTVLDNE